MSNRRNAAAVALSAVVLTMAGCGDDAGTAGTADATETAPSGAASPSEAVVAHAKAYAALVDHPVYVQVQTAEPEMLPAFVDEVTQGKLNATSNGNVWTFTDVVGECATKLSTDRNGGEVYKTTCGGVAVDDEFKDALREALAP